MDIEHTSQLDESYIAYFDILGYKAAFEDDGSADELFDSIINLTQEFLRKCESGSLGIKGFETKVFSDNFLITASLSADLPEKRLVRTLMGLVAYIQLHCLSAYSLLIRGGITFGPIYIDSAIVFGEGLVRAVGLEASALFPRVVFDDEVVTRIESLGVHPDEYLWCKDFDGRWYINFFAPYFNDMTPIDGTDIFYDRAGISEVDELKSIIEELVRKHCRYPSRISDQKKIIARDSIIRKYLWLLIKFNSFCNEQSHESNSISFTPTVNKRLMRFELRC